MSESTPASVDDPESTAAAAEPKPKRRRKRKQSAAQKADGEQPGAEPQPDEVAPAAAGEAAESGGSEPDEGQPPESAEGAVPEEAPDEAQGDAAQGAEGPGEDSGEASGETAEDAPDASQAPDVPEVSDEELVRQVSALLFASPDPLGPGRLAKALSTSQKRVKAALAEIQKRLGDSGLGIELRGLAGGSTFMTPPELSDAVAGLSKHAAVERISPAALETLAVIAYRQPVTKAEIEAIRGVQAGPVLRSLVDRGLVRVVGRSDEPGHALQYGTTKEFLERFGLESLNDLPRDGELARD